jgi:hypothetical protein
MGSSSTTLLLVLAIVAFILLEQKKKAAGAPGPRPDPTLGLALYNPPPSGNASQYKKGTGTDARAGAAIGGGAGFAGGTALCGPGCGAALGTVTGLVGGFIGSKIGSTKVCRASNGKDVFPNDMAQCALYGISDCNVCGSLYDLNARKWPWQ